MSSPGSLGREETRHLPHQEPITFLPATSPDDRNTRKRYVTPVKIPDLKEQYVSLDTKLEVRGEGVIDTQCLLAFEYQYPDQPAQVSMDTDEFTALCPWTCLPDYGTLTIDYTPSDKLIELKSLKYYLLSFRDVGIVQEHAANRILQDLVDLCRPRAMKVTLDYKVRGGIHTVVTAEYPNR